LNDDQLAAVIAADIAEVLEKQVILLNPSLQKLAIAGLASEAIGAVVPGAGLVSVATGLKGKSLMSAAAHASARTGMALMTDAGYDPAAAPVAWWLLSSSDEKKPVEDLAMPERSRYLYSLLRYTTGQAASH
jgi:predicted Zn-dependent protease